MSDPDTASMRIDYLEQQLAAADDQIEGLTTSRDQWRQLALQLMRTSLEAVDE